jgi:hypothetical protein
MANFTGMGQVKFDITDFRLQKVYENGLKSVKNKCNNWKETSLRKTAAVLDPILYGQTDWVGRPDKPQSIDWLRSVHVW